MGLIDVKRRTLAVMQEFVDHMPEAAHDGVIRQIAMQFGLLYAGSHLRNRIWRLAVDEESRAKVPLRAPSATLSKPQSPSIRSQRDSTS